MNARLLIEALRREGQSLSVAESLTGGLLASALVNVPGASDVFVGGVVAYTISAKRKVLGVQDEALTHGVVSREVAISMAVGVRELFGSDYAIATTGIAGPGPQEGLEAGTIWRGCASHLGSAAVFVKLAGERNEIRIAAVNAALELIETQGIFGPLRQ